MKESPQKCQRIAFAFQFAFSLLGTEFHGTERERERGGRSSGIILEHS